MGLRIDKEKYLSRLIERVNENKASGIYRTVRINEKIDDETARYISNFFKGLSGYQIEMVKCRNCKNVWDITIYNSNK